MKERLKKIFNSNTLGLVVVIFGAALIFEFIVFPGLTEANTIVNIFVLLVGLFTILLTIYLVPFYFINWKKMFELTLDDLKLGETELDYIPKSDMGSIGTKPKTQTDYAKEHTANLSKKRKQNKSEFPVEPHRSTVKKSNPKQFDGVKSEEPFVKTKKK